jgi:hypothetical protein
MDLLGKEFISVEFGKDKYLSWDNHSSYPKTLGKTGIVKNIHDTYSQYVCISFKEIENYGIPLELHWPIEIVMNQVLDKERLDPVYLDNIYKEIFKAIKVICLNKRR